MNNKIKVIFFDLGQTLIELSSLSTCMYDSLKKHSPQLTTDLNKLVYKWGHETYRLFLEYREKKFITTKEIHFLSLKKILKMNNIDIPDRVARATVKDVWKKFVGNNKLCVDVMPVLNQLKKTGYTLGLITDCDKDVVDGILKKHKLENYFDVKIISGVMGVYKPNSILFVEALELAKCKPDEAIYVGDSELDIKGANETGLITVVVNRTEMRTPAFSINPNFRINSLSELPELISETNNK